MKHLILTVTIFTFFAWLLPLGIFIKPSQEKIACDGQRAICLCRHSPALEGKPIDGLVLKLPVGAQKDEGAKGGANHFFLVSQAKINQDLDVLRRFEQEFCNYKDPHLAIPEHIPLV